MRIRPRILTILVADAAGLLTALVIIVPSFHFAYKSTPLHASFETSAALVAVLAALLFYGRYRHSGRADELVLVASLTLLAGSSAFAAMPWALAGRSDARFVTWVVLVGVVAGAGVLALSALLPPVTFRRRTATWMVGAVGAFYLLDILVVGSYESSLPLGIEPTSSPPLGPAWPVGAAPVIAMQVVAALLFAAAAFGFTRRAERTGDELMSWLGATAAAAASARLAYAVFPSLYNQWFYVGDVMRLAAYVLLLVGAAREVARYQRSLADAAVLEERRRIARDLHDGLAQELAFIATRARVLTSAATGVPEDLRHLRTAAERALDEARRAIAALSHPVDEPLDVSLVQTVEEVAHRVGAQARFNVDCGVHVSAETKEALLRIVREAVTNASRHGNARMIDVELTNGDGLHLRVADDGVGFDPEQAASADGFGLVTMRERARAIGGDFRITSKPRAGTQIEVVIP